MPRSSKYGFFVTLAILIIILVAIIIYYRSIIIPVPEMPKYLNKPRIVVNSDLFIKRLFWKGTMLGNITDIRSSSKIVNIAGTKGYISLDKNLNKLSYVKFNTCSSHTDILFSNDDVKGFINSGNPFCEAAFFDRNGKALWNYGGKTGIFDMCAGDIDNDREVEFVVGFNGSGGVHLLNKNGEKIWNKPDSNVWHVELVDTNGDGFLEIVHSNAMGQIIVRDRQGMIISKNKSSPYISEFSLTKWPLIKDGYIILLSSNDRIWLLDFNGEILAQLDAHQVGTLGHARGLSIKFQNDHPEYFAVIVEFEPWDRSVLYIYNSKKEIVYQEIINEACPSIATAKSINNQDVETLLIGCKGNIWQYEREI